MQKSPHSELGAEIHSHKGNSKYSKIWQNLLFLTVAVVSNAKSDVTNLIDSLDVFLT